MKLLTLRITNTADSYRGQEYDVYVGKVILRPDSTHDNIKAWLVNDIETNFPSSDYPVYKRALISHITNANAISEDLHMSHSAFRHLYLDLAIEPISYA